MADLNEIVVFAKVVETRSFTAAAQQLGLPKSTVSRKVSQLEERLSARLIQRTTRKLSLTEIGQAFYERCARIVTDIALAEQFVTDMQSTPRGILRVSAPVDLGSFRLAELTARFLAEHPDLHVHLDLTDRLVDLVDEAYDLAVRFGPLEESSLIARRLCGVTFRLFASAAYLDAHPPIKEPDDLAEHDLLAFVPSARLATWTLLGPAGATVELTPSARLTSNNLLAIRQALQAGGGVGFLPEFVRCDNGTSLRVVLPDWHSRSGDLYAVYPSVRNLSPKVRVYLDFLGEHLRLPDEAAA
ncbi:MAG: LysR family transcriptional regulator [Kofleriaceae bacterium]|nr:LysR family transcriptional regulator [Kofleriaceae bacterium]MCL4226784.1 LysR family transcriptional regulator [Myxococcales bacterium]